ncbi:alpha/beta fold hydrolase [Streptomyces sp. NPDC052701]|uniref:alpha/beta hydrolase n=1 Tax=Streptomyces sp. NPDC052701 TaxID=3155533 RepID=UPI00341432EB
MTQRETVVFPGDRAKLTGTLFLPADTPGTGPSRLPAVVVAGTWTSVKEQMADRYAERLARLGYAALSFDFTGFGESGGEPRDYESPAQKTDDLRHAVTFLAGHPRVDVGRIGALGICAGAMYVSANAVDDPRVRSLALVAPWLHDARVCRDAYGGEAEVARRVAAGRAARAAYEATGEVEYVPMVSARDPRAALPYEIDFYLSPERGGIPAWPNRFAVMSWAEWLTFDALALAPRLDRPTLLVHSPDAAIPDGARRFHESLAGPARIHWTTGTQFDFYDREPQVSIAVEEAGRHFRDTL